MGSAGKGIFCEAGVCLVGLQDCHKSESRKCSAAQIYLVPPGCKKGSSLRVGCGLEFLR